jgi:hypothetical protein
MKPNTIARWFIVIYFSFLGIRSILAARFATDLIGASNMAGAIGGALLCALLAYKIFFRPREWGIGVGVFIVVMIVIQIFLWKIGGDRLRQTDPSYQPHLVRFVIEEVMNLVAASVCFTLRCTNKSMPNQSTDPTLSSGTPAAGQPARHP